MKKLLVLIIVVAFAHSAFADEHQHFESVKKTLGECQMTHISVLKSKEFPLGTTTTNEVVRFTLNEDISPDYHDIYMGFEAPNEGTCPTLGCRSSEIAHSNIENVDDQLISNVTFKSNSEEMLDVVFKTDSNQWSRLTYDFKTGVGSYEERLKINDFGGFLFKNIVNDHIIREIRNCTFSGPVNLYPKQ